jgi:hypothetical protein
VGHQYRYKQFARVRGFELGSPDSPMMHEYIEWIKGKWSQWWAHVGLKPTYLTPEVHDAFDAWLAKEKT